MTDDIYGDSDASDARARQRRELLETTAQLLADQGRSALSVRRIADRCDVSTQMIYTLFGGKSELLRSLHRHGYEKLAEYFDELPDELGPHDRLAALGRAYRQFALDHPSLYRMMTGPPSADHDRARAAADRDTRSFQMLEDCIRRCIEEGDYGDDLDPREVADIHWAMVHGAVGLEIAGFYDDPEVAASRFAMALEAVASRFREA